MPSDATSPAVVVGTGPAGLAAALALASEEIPVVLLGPEVTAQSAARDTRTTALFGGSIALLHGIGAWERLADAATPLSGLRLIDDTGSLLRAPEMLFRATELELAQFGYNIANADLLRALSATALAHPHISVRPATTVAALDLDGDCARVSLASGEVIAAQLVVAADGRRSLCRSAAGIKTSDWAWPQSALATTFVHSRPHQDISTEFHRRAGPLTVVPMAGRRSSLVWVETPSEAQVLAAMAEPEFARALEIRLQGLLGTITDIGPRAAFPLSGLSASPLAACRVALVGEAGHVLPPIGAQGLNLGFRDAAWIAELAGRAARDGRDIGSPAVLETYDAARRPDVSTRSGAVSLLNRSLVADFLPFDAARGAALTILNAVPWLRRTVMSEGIGPSAALPRLLRFPQE